MEVRRRRTSDVRKWGRKTPEEEGIKRQMRRKSDVKGRIWSQTSEDEGEARKSEESVRCRVLWFSLSSEGYSLPFRFPLSFLCFLTCLLSLSVSIFLLVPWNYPRMLYLLFIDFELELSAMRRDFNNRFAYNLNKQSPFLSCFSSRFKGVYLWSCMVTSDLRATVPL